MTELPRTPFLRLVTRSQPMQESLPLVFQERQNQEIQVPLGTWHLRCTIAGRRNGPMCNATCADQTHWTDCHDFIKKVGFKPNPTSGVVGVACEGYLNIRGVVVLSLLWFCLNNLCHQAWPQKFIGGLSPMPSMHPVQFGTNLIAAEIAFLTEKGLDFVGRPKDPVLSMKPCSFK
jgi:hypothetical protein